MPPCTEQQRASHRVAEAHGGVHVSSRLSGLGWQRRERVRRRHAFERAHLMNEDVLGPGEACTLARARELLDGEGVTVACPAGSLSIENDRRRRRPGATRSCPSRDAQAEGWRGAILER